MQNYPGPHPDKCPHGGNRSRAANGLFVPTRNPYRLRPDFPCIFGDVSAGYSVQARGRHPSVVGFRVWGCDLGLVFGAGGFVLGFRDCEVVIFCVLNLNPKSHPLHACGFGCVSGCVKVLVFLSVLRSPNSQFSLFSQFDPFHLVYVFSVLVFGFLIFLGSGSQFSKFSQDCFSVFSFRFTLIQEP